MAPLQAYLEVIVGHRGFQQLKVINVPRAKPAPRFYGSSEIGLSVAKVFAVAERPIQRPMQAQPARREHAVRGSRGPSRAPQWPSSGLHLAYAQRGQRGLREGRRSGACAP